MLKFVGLEIPLSYNNCKTKADKCKTCQRRQRFSLRQRQPSYSLVRYYALAEVCQQPDKSLNEKASWLKGFYSCEFRSLCEAQFRILEDSIGIDNFVLFFRKENEHLGCLEFVPICSFPGVSSVWVVEEGRGSLPFIMHQPLALPGGMEPSCLLPEYPFVSFREGVIYHLEDGRITIPIHCDRVVVGLLLIGKNGKSVWTKQEEHQILQCAKTIAVASTLNLRWQVNSTSTVDLPKIQKLFSNVLHQVQSPMMAMKTFAKLLSRRLPEEDSNTELIQGILFQTERLQQLLSPLQQMNENLQRQLSLAGNANQLPASYEDEEMKSPKSVQLHLCWIKDVIQPVLSSFRLVAREKGIRFSSKIERDLPPCLLEEQMLREVVSNICDNAIQYTPSGGVIRVQCYWDTKNDCVSMDICDTGVGIPSEELAKVFQRGYRASNVASNKETPGNGIGLSIAFEMIQKMNGSLNITCPGKLEKLARKEAKGLPGCCVHISFPRASYSRSYE